MFSDVLRDVIASRRLTVAEVAAISGFPAVSIAEFEAGTATPTFDDAERLLKSLDRCFAVVTVTAQQPTYLAESVLEPLYGANFGRAAVLRKARQDQATIVESDAMMERLELTWPEVKTIVEGAPVPGDEYSVWRAKELAASARRALRIVDQGFATRLEAVCGGTVVTADPTADPPRQAIDFLVRATQYGADPAHIRHLVGAFLVHHGYPWLWIPHKQQMEYRRALVACKQYGSGNAMAELLVASIERTN